MTKEIYNTREILLGLRKVYQENRRQLDELKNYCTISSKISDSSFFLYPYGAGTYDFNMYYTYLLSFDEGGLIKANNLQYNISNIFVNKIDNKVAIDNKFISVKKHKDFIKAMDEIYNSEFTRLIVRNNMKSIDNNPVYMFTSLNEVNLFANQDNKLLNSSLTYDAYNDKLNFTLFYDMSVSKDFINEALNNMLDVNFHKGQFSHYILENIDEKPNSQIELYNYRTNADSSKTYIFGIDCDKKLIKSKKSTF